MGLSRKRIIMLAVLVFGTFVTVLNQTVVAPALPSVMAEMSVDASTAQWLTTGFTLVNAIMIPITAFLTDRFTTKRLFLVSMAIFTAGSALAGWGPSFAVLLLGRLVQAAGAGHPHAARDDRAHVDVPRGQARHGHGPVRHRHRVRPGHRPHGRRRHHRPLHLA